MISLSFYDAFFHVHYIRGLISIHKPYGGDMVFHLNFNTCLSLTFSIAALVGCHTCISAILGHRFVLFEHHKCICSRIFNAYLWRI